MDIIQHPLHKIDPHAQLRTLGVTDSLTISLQVAFYGGIVISFPLLLYFLAQFVLPALVRQEKKYVLPAIAIGFGLFLTGVTFSYFLILPKTLGWFWLDTKSFQWEAGWTATQYFSFVTQMTLVFGLAFELPVAVVVEQHALRPRPEAQGLALAMCNDVFVPSADYRFACPMTGITIIERSALGLI